MKNIDIEITPLGGLNKIGSNICYFKSNKISFAIDAGIKFPDEDFFDINYSFPSLAPIESLDYLIITHGHEDHIGGIPKVVEKFPDVTILTTAFNDYLIKDKLTRYQTNAKIEVIDEGLDYKLSKDLSISFIHVNHSIPFTKGIHIQSRDTSILFISDFKIEDHGLYETPFNLAKLKNLGTHKKWRVAMLDSTSIFSEKRRYNELDVYNNLEKLISTVNKKIFITTFASNVNRIISIIKIAYKIGKKVFVKSPAMIRFIDIASKYQLVEESILSKTVVTSERNISNNSIILVSGSQGEKRSSLRNLLFNKKGFTKINDGDVFCFSSKIIPGNERNVFNIYDEITKKGGIIFNDKDGFHSSGHADQDDLKRVYEAYAPNYAIPIHGSIYFLNKHKEFIEENFPKINTINVINFDQIKITNEKIKISNEIIPSSDHYQYFFGKKYLPIMPGEINERKKMAEKGLVSVVAKKKKGIFEFISFQTLGLPEINDFENNHDVGLLEVLNMVDFKGSNDEQTIRESINKYFEQHLGCRPKSIIHFV